LIDNEEIIGFKRSKVARLVNLITLFSFDKGQGLSEHSAPYDALVYIMDGEMTVTISGEIFHLQRGEMIIMPSNEPHALKALSRFKMLLTMIRPQT